MEPNWARFVEPGRPGVSDPGYNSDEFVFLNNALLEAGHAVRYDGGPKEE